MIRLPKMRVYMYIPFVADVDRRMKQKGRRRTQLILFIHSMHIILGHLHPTNESNRIPRNQRPHRATAAAALHFVEYHFSLLWRRRANFMSFAGARSFRLPVIIICAYSLNEYTIIYLKICIYVQMFAADQLTTPSSAAINYRLPLNFFSRSI